MNRHYLFTGGHRHGIHIRLDVMESAGPFTGGGHKLCFHTTEGNGIDGALTTLQANRDAPHIVMDPRTGETVQTLPFNVAGRSLKHVAPPETNRANVIQIELVGFAAETHDWPELAYRRIAYVSTMIMHRVPIPNRMAAGVSFHHPRRISPVGFVRAAGICGHVHVPGNTHTDPGTGFRGALLRKIIKEYI